MIGSLSKKYLIGIVVAAVVVYVVKSVFNITSLESKIDQLQETIAQQQMVIMSNSRHIESIQKNIHPVGFRWTPKDLDCLAKNIFHEARNEPREGQVAVARVTINRVENGSWGDTICKVVYSPSQFSWTLKKELRNYQPRGIDWEKSQEIARSVLINGESLRWMDTALFYHADYVDPHWNHERYEIVKIGRHIFYSGAKGHEASTLADANSPSQVSQLEQKIRKKTRFKK